MSGIAGTFAPNQSELVLKMLRKIKHRGTSKPKVWEGPRSTLGAIGLHEVSEKPGPLSLNGDDQNIVLDGRLINVEKLPKNSLPKNTVEAEIILRNYLDQENRVFDKLDGEFALAIAQNGHLVLARDRLGIRPLYHGFHEGALCFASEMKALVDFVDEIREFPPGHFLHSDSGLFPYRPYLPEDLDFEKPVDSAHMLNEHLRKAVQRAIPDDVEVGVWLSGGIDSSAVAALARPLVDRLHTFSAGTEGASDLEFASKVAQHIGSEHHKRIYTVEDMLRVLDNVIYQLESFDAHLVRSAIANYLVSELASEHVPFVLSGEGGDELFAGYDYQKECNGEVELTLSVQDAIAALHNTALQRVDRSASSHGTGAAVPILDPEVVRYALAIPARWKIRGPEEVEKWPLRKAVADELPDEVIWREKVKFWQGTDAKNLLSVCAEREISDSEFQAERDLRYSFMIRSKEELLYYRVFQRFFGDKVPLDEVGRTQHI